MKQFKASYLRGIIAKEITPFINVFRKQQLRLTLDYNEEELSIVKNNLDKNFLPTDSEIDFFIDTNPFFDDKLRSYEVGHGITSNYERSKINFDLLSIKLNSIEEFVNNTKTWSTNLGWLKADGTTGYSWDDDIVELIKDFVKAFVNTLNIDNKRKSALEEKITAPYLIESYWKTAGHDFQRIILDIGIMDSEEMTDFIIELTEDKDLSKRTPASKQNIIVVPGDRYSMMQMGFKRHLLYFDKLTFEKSRFELTLQYFSKFSKFANSKEFGLFKDYEIARNNNLIDFINPGPMYFSTKYYEVQHSMSEMFWEKKAELEEENDSLSAQLRELYELVKKNPDDAPLLEKLADVESSGYVNEYAQEYLTTRFRVALLKTFFPDNNYYSHFDEFPTGLGQKAEKKDIVTTVLDFFPLISNEIGIEKVLEFKADKDSRERFLELKNWINELSRSDYSVAEIKEKTEYLIDAYKKRLDLHKLKFEKGKLQVIAEGSAEVLENIAKLNFSKVVKALFSVKNKKVELLESELNLKGREISYIVKASDSLQDGSSKYDIFFK